MIAHQQLLEKRKQGRIDVYFEGDYPELLANWNRNFFGWNADRVENILWRLENGELDDVNPQVQTAIFPRNDNIDLMPVINRTNANLAKLADGKKIRYLNINGKLADEDGKLLDGMMKTDKLHPALKGDQVWVDALKPPAREDHAPPPTGDPSARK